MSRYLELVMAALLYYSGVVWLARWWMRRRGKRLVVLCYHCAAGGFLREHVLYLRRHYRIVPLEAGLEELYGHASNEVWTKARPTLLALTFDDGYQDHYSYGLPLACELKVPMTMFLIPGYVESGDCFWWHEAERLVTGAQVSEVMVGGRKYDLGRLAEKKDLVEMIDGRLRYSGSVAEQEAMLGALRQVLGDAESACVPASHLEPSVGFVSGHPGDSQQSQQRRTTRPANGREETRSSVSWDEVKEMEASGWISYGAHTMRHPILARLKDAEERQYEVNTCRVVLKKRLGHAVRTFAYPVGRPEDIGGDGVAMVRRAGYDWALTTVHGVNTQQTDPYLLHRIVVDVDQHWLMVAAKACGVWDMLVGPWRRLPLLMGELIGRGVLP
jgi:peptidoglycan/xylan/chitin deacetylase (PgdA/CDA1 family)